MKQIVPLQGLFSRLVHTEHQVDPMVKVRRDVLRLESLAVDLHELLWSRRPWRQLDIVHKLIVLASSEVYSVDVL